MSSTYLFEAVFNDGTSIKQNPEDESTITPGKNCFYDVLQRIADVVTFTISNDENTATVYLKTGLFELNGVTFAASNPSQQFPHDTQFRLIYFRRITHSYGAGIEHGMHTANHIGWQTTVDGTNHQQTIALD